MSSVKSWRSSNSSRFSSSSATLATQRLREKTGEVGDREEAKEVAEEPEAQTVRSRGCAVRAWNFAGVRKHRQPAQEQQAQRSDAERRAPRKQNTVHDDHQQIQGNEIAVLQAGGVHQRGHHQHIADDLQSSVPGRIRNPAQQDDVDGAKGNPENDERKKRPRGRRRRPVLRPYDANGENQRNQKQTHARQPIQPLFSRGGLINRETAAADYFESQAFGNTRWKRVMAGRPPSCHDMHNLLSAIRGPLLVTCR